MVQEFKDFINRGNLVEIAVAFVMGIAFAAVITSLTNDVINPIIAKIFDVQDLAEWIVWDIRIGAFLAAIFVGMIDTLGRAFLPDLLRMVLSSAAASTAAPALSSMLIYLLMAIVLVVRPEGLFPAAKR